VVFFASTMAGKILIRNGLQALTRSFREKHVLVGLGRVGLLIVAGWMR